MNLEVLSRPEYVVFTTREYAEASNIAAASASRQLGATAERGPLVRLTRGVWANPSHPYFHPLACVPKLLGNEQGYVSFLTALHRREIIQQIPRSIQVATTGHARQLCTPGGSYEFLHVTPKMMRRGIEWADTRVPYRIATAEKALLDTLYISRRRGRRFRSLPEVDLRPVTKRRFTELLQDIDDPRIATAVRERFETMRQSARLGSEARGDG